MKRFFHEITKLTKHTKVPLYKELLRVFVSFVVS
jgi:hypothetical protein